MNRRVAELIADTVIDVYGSLLVQYIGAFIEPSAQRTIEQWWKKTTGVPLLAKKKIDHMTVIYDCTPEQVDEADFGKKMQLKIVGWAADDKVQAIVVKPSIKVSRLVPHITIAVASDGDTAQSNDLLRKGYKKVSGPTVTATLGWSDWSGRVSYDKPII